MTVMPDDVDPALSEHVVAIRDRFGLDGLREAARLIAMEIAIFDRVYDDLPADQPLRDTSDGPQTLPR
jgi:hypothetical protein